jgi:hypothetical protein
MENLRGWTGQGFKKGITSTEPVLKYFEFSQPFRETGDERQKNMCAPCLKRNRATLNETSWSWLRNNRNSAVLDITHTS